MSAKSAARRFLTIKQLTERWACSRGTIERLSRTDPTFPKFFKIGSTKRIAAEDDVEVYERSRVVAR